MRNLSNHAFARVVSPATLAVLVMLGSPVSALAQERSHRFDAVAVAASDLTAVPSPVAAACADPWPCVGAATAGALAGVVGGGLLGAGILGGLVLICCEATHDDGGPALAAFFGGIGGAALGLPVGAHLGNRRRGSLIVDVLAAGAVGGAAALVVLNGADRSGWTIPVGALAGAVAAEVVVARLRR